MAKQSMVPTLRKLHVKAIRELQNILVTGGAGFIGSNFIHLKLNDENFKGRIINIDSMTYAGDLNNLSDLPQDSELRYTFVEGDICDKALLEQVFREYQIDTVVHFAAESHVDRSIDDPLTFLNTNIIGTFNLLSVSKDFWKERSDVIFHHVSTDEVYGALGETGVFTEQTPYDPRSPYSASKASSDHIVRAFFHTYKLPILITNCSNNYGPRQHPEKLIPLMITKILKGENLPVYGEGKNIRDWVFVEDHNRALWFVLSNGVTGETYNIGGNTEIQNIDLVRTICRLVSEKKGEDLYRILDLITFVKDRPGHDFRYAIDNSKIKSLGYNNEVSFEEGLSRTIDWYLG